MRRLFSEYGLVMVALLAMISGIGFFCTNYLDRVLNNGLLVWLDRLI